MAFTPYSKNPPTPDIDDTLKITGVLDTATALQNTFLNDPEPIAGMPDVLSSLQSSLSDPAFFYISGSPFQLYPFLHDFIDSTYPAGPMCVISFLFPVMIDVHMN